jgi:lysophospholipase L1-like esterase
MTTKLNRRGFLKVSFIGLAAIVSACAKVLNKPAGTATPVPTPTLDITPKTYAPDDAHILYTGRIDFTDPQKPKFSAPGVYIQARFRGTSASVMLKDEFKYGTSRNYYDAVIDDATVVKIAPDMGGTTKYPVASGLPYGEHSLTLVKRTEASVGSCQFLGFEFDGEILPAPAAPARRIEIIGDSICCGTGAEALNGSPQCQEDGWGQPYNNARLAFGPVMARALNAAYHLTAVSGIGLTRDYSFKYDARPMPEVYDLIFLEQANTAVNIWDTSRFVPDVIVIALGTNDFSPGDSDRPSLSVDDFAAAYVQSIGGLRDYYPNASIFCVTSPMLGDRWPTSADRFSTDQINAIIKVVGELNNKGDAKVYKFMATKIVGMGCGTHPNVDQQAAMAEELRLYVASVMGW